MPRMIFDLPLEIQMAIRIRAVKADQTTGEVVTQAIEEVFDKEIEEAKIAITEQEKSNIIGRELDVI